MFIPIIIGLFTLSVGLRNEKSLAYPPTLFSLLWLLICIFLSLKLLPYYEISVFTYFIVGIGILFFMIGGRLAKKSFYNHYHKSYRSLNIYLFLLLELSSFLFSLPDVMKSIAAIQMGISLEDIRSESGNIENTGGFIPYLRNFILTPISYICYSVYAYIVLSRKFKPHQIIIATILTFLLILSSVTRLGGRSPIIFLIISLTITYYFINRGKKISKKEALLFFFLIVLATSAFYITSLSRGIENVNDSVYGYFTGCVPMLNQGINNLKSYYFGVATFSSPISLVNSFTNFVGMGQMPIQKTIDAFNIGLDENVTIGDGMHMNAFFSIFYWFYIDFGIIGVILFSALYGWLCSFYYYKAKYDPSPKRIILFSFLMQGLLLSFIRFHFATFYYFMAFVISPILFTKKSPKI